MLAGIELSLLPGQTYTEKTNFLLSSKGLQLFTDNLKEGGKTFLFAHSGADSGIAHKEEALVTPLHFEMHFFQFCLLASS